MNKRLILILSVIGIVSCIFVYGSRSENDLDKTEDAVASGVTEIDNPIENPYLDGEEETTDYTNGSNKKSESTASSSKSNSSSNSTTTNTESNKKSESTASSNKGSSSSQSSSSTTGSSSNSGQSNTSTGGSSTAASEYEAYHAMSGAEQKAYLESFESIEAFFEWYNAAAAEYEAAHPDIEIENGSVDLSQITGN